MNTYQDLHNRHEVYIARLATSMRNQYTDKNLIDSYKIAKKILYESGEITSITQLNQVATALAKEVGTTTTEMWASATLELDSFAAQEAKFYAGMFGTVNAVDMTLPADKKILGYINKSVMNLGTSAGTWADFTKANTDTLTKSYANQIRIGYSNQESPNQMIKRVKDISNGLLQRQAETLVRTGTSHYAAQSREAMMMDNLDVVDRKIFSAFFDNRTTLICRGFSGNIYNIDDKSAPQLPQHFSCRSTYQFLVKGQKDLSGTRAAVGGKKGEEAKEEFEKRNAKLNAQRNDPDRTKETASQVRRKGNKDDVFTAGQIKASTKMDDWMAQQPKWFREDSLGVERAKLFDSGKYSLASFTDLTGRPLTLAELAAKK